MPDEPVDSQAATVESTAEGNELQGVLDEELANLSEKLRTVFVLCGVEGRTNAEVSALLGIPVGTVDSRLHAAREKLKGRLIKRGLAGTALTVATAPGAGAGVSDELIQSTVKAALAFASGSDLAGPMVTTLAKEMSSAMTAFPFRTIASAAMIATLVGGIGSGVYFAQAGQGNGTGQSPAVVQKKQDEKEAETVVSSTPAKAESTAEVTTAPKTTAETLDILKERIDIESDLSAWRIGLIFEMISKKYHVAFRIDENFMRQNGIDNVLEKTIKTSYRANQVTIQDLLDDIGSQAMGMPKGTSFRVKAGQIIFGKPLAPYTNVFSGGREDSSVTSVHIKDKTLEQVVQMLIDETGINIVLDRKQLGKEPKDKINLTLNNVSVYTILKIVSDQCGLDVAVMENVYYVTSIHTADNLNQQVRQTLLSASGEDKPQSVFVPVNAEGRFIAPGPDGFRGQKVQLIPILVESEKPKPDAKPQAKAGEAKP